MRKTIRIIIISIGLVVAFVIGHKIMGPHWPRTVVERFTPCSDSADRLALDRLFPLLQNSISDHLDVWLSNNYTNEFWQPQFNEQQAKIDDLRAWALKIEDSCARNAYLGWLDHYQQKLDSARKELSTHEQERGMEDYDRKNREEEERVKRYAEQVDGAFPSPPTNR